MTKPTENELFDINQPFVTQEQKFKYWEESKAEIKRLQAHAELANKEKAELQAQINELREALNQIGLEGYKDQSDLNTIRKVIEISKEALAKTAPQSLQKHDNEVIERCAKVCENTINRESANWIVAYSFAEAIRALKG